MSGFVIGIVVGLGLALLSLYTIVVLSSEDMNRGSEWES